MGEQLDPEAQLYFLRARYYDATTGRFISRDPVKGLLTNPQTLNPYVYVGNNPINLSDPSGKYWGAFSIDNIHKDWNSCQYGKAIAKTAVVAVGTGVAAAGAVYLGAEALIAGGSVVATQTTLWPSQFESQKVINGITYTKEALMRMAPEGFGGRGMPPSVVQNAIEWGSKSAGNIPGRIVIDYENVRVITNAALDTVISVIKLGH